MAAERAAPHSIEAEQAVLGGLLLQDATAWPRVASLEAADFYRPDHRLIFAAIAEVCGAGRAADVVLAVDALERRGQLTHVGGLSYLGTLVRDTPGTANIEAYAARVRSDALLRRLQDFSAQIAREASQGTDVGETVLARAQERLLVLQTSARTGEGLVSVRDLAPGFVDDLDSRAARHSGLQVGLSDFDELTHGLEPGDLVVIAARPGMGKTALLVTIGAHVARSQQVAVFSAEMPARQLMRRCVALLGTIQQGRLRRADQLTDSDWKAIAESVSDLSDRHLWIDDTSAPTLTHVRSECMGLKARAGLGLVIVDYVQLVQGRGANRYEQLRDVAYGFKALAKDLSVPVIVLAQLNRGVESRGSKEPEASDLRDSGAIEEAADIIGLLYSKSYYHPDFAMPDVLECRIAKHRNGERGECLWSFSGAHSRITVLDAGDRAQYRRLKAQQDGPGRRAANDL